MLKSDTGCDRNLQSNRRGRTSKKTVAGLASDVSLHQTSEPDSYSSQTGAGQAKLV